MSPDSNRSQILHILTTPPDAWLENLLARQRERQDTEVRVVNMHAGNPDYRDLLHAIFEADSVNVW